MLREGYIPLTRYRYYPIHARKILSPRPDAAPSPQCREDLHGWVRTVRWRKWNGFYLSNEFCPSNELALPTNLQMLHYTHICGGF